jgi:TonB-linked SusC/RagA family outer membrane protein
MKKRKYHDLILYAMKFTIVQIALSITFVCSIYANKSSGQNVMDRSISMKVENVEITKILSIIKEKAGVKFVYSSRAIDADRKMTVDVVNKKLRDFINEFIIPLGISYAVLDNQVLLYAEDKSHLNEGILSNKIGLLSLAQKGNIASGKVVDENGKPLEGASITLKSNRGVATKTDAFGNFKLEISGTSSLLLVSYIGFKTVEVNVKSGETVTVILQSTSKDIGDIVVIGYGTQKRIDRTGASSTIKGDKLASVPVGSFDAALQGRAPGLQVSQGDGTPGSPVRIQVRGTSSVSSGTEPLYVVDGMIIFQDITGTHGLNPLININSNDIESIEVLKDAAATAIYGSRGANGVILVTTKTGKKGQGKTSIDVNRGITSATKTMNYVNGSQWLEMVDKARTNSVNYGISPTLVSFDPLTLVNNNLPTPAGIAGIQFGPNTAWTRALANQTNVNWADQLLQQGTLSEVNVSTSNGFDKGSFYLSGQVRDEAGIIKNNSLKRYSLRSNIEFNPNSKIKTGARFSFSFLDSKVPQLGIGSNGASVGRGNTGASGGWGQANNGSLPIMPIYNTDGTYFDPLRGRNLVAGNDANNYRNEEFQNRFVGNVFAAINILPELTLRVEGSSDFLNSNAIIWVGDIIRYNKRGDEIGRFIQNYSGTAYLNYDKTFNTDHNLTFTLGTESQETKIRRQDYAFEGLVGTQQEIGEIANGQTQFITAVSGILPDRRFTSYFGRANYKFKDRYLLGASFRRDGATPFGVENRYGNFPAASAGWIISNEPFAINNGLLDKFSFLKFRASYGQTGNANIPSFAYLNNYVNWPVYGQSASLAFSVLANPNIGWEKNNQLDMALEYGFLNNRIKGSIGYFDRVSKGMLLNVPVAPSVGIGAGTSSVITNIGDLRNKGLEFEISSTNLNPKSKFRWTTDFNISFIKNNVLDLTPQFKTLPVGANPVANGIQQGVGITQVGAQLGNYYLAEYAGLDKEGFETIYEIDNNILKQTGNTVKTGNIIRATQTNINNNRIVQTGKQGLPTWYGGLTNSFSYKGFDLNVLFTFSGGNYIYDGLRENDSYVRTGTNVILADVYNNTWESGNTNAAYPKLTWNLRDNFNNASTGLPAPQTMGTRTTRFLYKGDFIRLKSLQLAYNLPIATLQKIHLQGFRVYINVNNLLTITKYPGFDPEYANFSATSQDRNLNQGLIGSSPVPQVRSINAGVSVTF